MPQSQTSPEESKNLCGDSAGLLLLSSSVAFLLSNNGENQRFTGKSEPHIGNTSLPISSMKNLDEKLDQSKSTSGENCESFNAESSARSDSLDEQVLQSETSLKPQASSKESNENPPPGNMIPYSSSSYEQTLCSVVPSKSQNLSKEKEEKSKSDTTRLKSLSSMENHENLTSGDTTPNSVSGNGKTPHSEVSSKSQDLSEGKEENPHPDNTQLTLLTCSVMSLPSYNVQYHLSDRTGRGPEKGNSCSDSAPTNLGEKCGQDTVIHSGVSRCAGGDADVQETSLSTSTTKSIVEYGPQKPTYRGVTRHRWTGKYEAHLWDGSCSKGLTRKGKQVYLGGYETAVEAAHAHDLTALKYWGSSASTKLNFPITNYKKEIEEMENMSREEFVTSLRRKCLSFTRGSSIYRGVTRRNRDGHWQARIKVACSKKDIYLGTFSTEEEAAKAYDIAAIELKGVNALTNFDISNYPSEGSKDSKGFSQPKRRRRCSKSSALTTSVLVFDCQPDKSNPPCDPQPNESVPECDKGGSLV